MIRTTFIAFAITFIILMAIAELSSLGYMGHLR